MKVDNQLANVLSLQVHAWSRESIKKKKNESNILFLVLSLSDMKLLKIAFSPIKQQKVTVFYSGVNASVPLDRLRTQCMKLKSSLNYLLL